MRRAVGKRWSQTEGESEEIAAGKNVIAVERVRQDGDSRIEKILD